jgi:putative spermidine/putrescine transport system substrate-binding protein
MRLIVAGSVGLLLLSTLVFGDDAQAAPQGPGASTADAAGSMIIVGWGGLSSKYWQDFFSDPFAAATGDQLRWVYASGQQVAAVQAQHAAGQIEWDVLSSLDGNQFALLSQQGLLQKLPPDVKAGLANQMPDGVTDVGVMFATLSDIIACNSKIAAACPKTPQDFFDVKRFPGQRSLYINDPLVAMAMALEADGVPANSVFPMDIDRAFRKLEVVRPLIRVFWQSGDQSQQIFRSGEVSMAVVWNGRAFDLANHPTDRMNIVVSWQGAVYEPSFTAVVSGAPHANAAYKFLQWVADHPDAMARYAEKTTYGFPNQDIFKSLPDSVAGWLPEFPAHFSGQVRLDYDWYIQHKSEVDTRWKEFTSAR